jgi:hypothetical protein
MNLSLQQISRSWEAHRVHFQLIAARRSFMAYVVTAVIVLAIQQGWDAQ